MKRVLFILTWLMISLAIYANPDIQRLISKTGSAKDYPGKSELIIFDTTIVNVQETGLSFVHIHKLVKMLNTKGCKNNAVIKFGYDPLSAYVEIRNVVIYRQSGEVDSLDMTTVLDYPAPARAIYWGAREKMIEVGKLEPGDAVDVVLFRKGYTYALLKDESDDERYIPPMRGHYYDIIEFWSREPVLNKVYQVQIPTDKLLQYEVYNGSLKSSVKYDASEEKNIYTLQFHPEVSHTQN